MNFVFMRVEIASIKEIYIKGKSRSMRKKGPSRNCSELQKPQYFAVCGGGKKKRGEEKRKPFPKKQLKHSNVP
jgi:hypothetical protein